MTFTAYGKDRLDQGQESSQALDVEFSARGTSDVDGRLTTQWQI